MPPVLDRTNRVLTASPGASPFMERRASANKHPWTLPQLTEMDELTRPIERSPPGDQIRRPATAQSMRMADLSRKKSEYFEDAFGVRGDRNPLRERLRSDSAVLVELKTNVIIGDEFMFITELGAKVAERYQRPLSSVAVHVQHSQCLLYAGTFDPAYVCTVSALPQYVQPATNRRNAHSLAEHLEEGLGVTSMRGLITFVPLPEDNVATNGKTLAHTLEDAGTGAYVDEKPKSIKSRRGRLSVKSLSNIRLPAVGATAAATAAAAGEMTPPTSADDAPGGGSDEKPVKVARRRKSFVTGLFSGRASITRRDSEEANR